MVVVEEEEEDEEEKQATTGRVLRMPRSLGRATAHIGHVVEALSGQWVAVGEVSGERHYEEFSLEVDPEALPGRGAKAAQAISVTGYSNPPGEFELSGQLVQADGADGEWDLELKQVYVTGPPR